MISMRMQPGFEFRRRAQLERVADVERVVERGALIVEHDVVGARHAHDIGAAGDAEQRQQLVHVVLVGVGMVGVADVDTHRQAEQLAAEMILEAGADDLLAVEEIFRTDETDDRVDEQRLEVPRDGVGARLHRLLVDAVMGVRRQRAPWPVSKYITLSPSVPRLSDSAASRASFSTARSMPKLLLAASLPAMDWKTRSTGAPCSMARKVVVT